ncbi:MAG: zinc ribbon domain-containing protein [Chloroflexi bacterium]|nr:zinc ribbon domain-containing protein [Chloroflexota bacterium]
MFCRYCGTEVLPETVFCIGCGKAIVPPGEKWHDSLLILFIVSSLIIPLVGFVTGIIGMTQKEKRIQGILLFALGIFTFVFWSTLLY